MFLMDELTLVETNDGSKYVGRIISSFARFPYSDKTYMIIDYDYYQYNGIWFPYGYNRIDSILIIDRSEIVEIFDDIIVTELQNNIIVSVII